MTSSDDDQVDSDPGFALPHGVDEPSVGEPTAVEQRYDSDRPDNSPADNSEKAPLTEMQQAVVDHISKAQDELGKSQRLARASRWGLWGAGLGAGSVLGAIDRGREDLHMKRVSDEDDAALFLAEQTHAGDSPQHIVPDGGPPTPEEVHEAEMNPWPHHDMAETIEHNRQLRASGQTDTTATE